MRLFLIITGIIMGILFFAYVIVLLIDHFAAVDGYDNPKDPLKILRKVFGYGFLLTLLVFFVANLIGFFGLIPY